MEEALCLGALCTEHQGSSRVDVQGYHNGTRVQCWKTRWPGPVRGNLEQTEPLRRGKDEGSYPGQRRTEPALTEHSAKLGYWGEAATGMYGEDGGDHRRGGEVKETFMFLSFDRRYESLLGG